VYVTDQLPGTGSFLNTRQIWNSCCETSRLITFIKRCHLWNLPWVIFLTNWL